MLIPPTAACNRATGWFKPALPEAIASSIDLIGTADPLPLPPRLRDDLSEAYTEGEEGFVGEGGEARGFVAPIPRERILIPGT